jgi:hypothetical protein
LFAEKVMPNIRIYRARIDIGDHSSGLLFSFDPINSTNTQIDGEQVQISQALTVFGDPLQMTVFDPDHSDDEDRYITMGESSNGRLLVVSHTDRENRIRIISARRATRRDRKAYEDG